MMRGLLLFLAISPLQAAGLQMLARLPHAAVSKAVQLDAQGNIYLAGSFAPAQPKDSQDGADAFVAKLSADGSKVIYFATLSGSFSESVAGIALAADGSVYAVGSTGSSDFPVTAGAYQTTFNLMGASQGFLTRINPSGAVAYATYLNGTAYTTATGIALGKGGEVYVTGSGGPRYPLNSGQPAQGYILELDPSMTTVLLSAYGYGGGLITLDGQGNLYLAGSAQPVFDAQGGAAVPPFPAGAFQVTHAASLCQASAGPGGPFSAFCPFQFVAKLDPAGKLLWGTYVTGTFGAAPAGMAVDSAGNVIVAGTTNSADYPVTPGAFQTAYTAAAPSLPIPPGYIAPPNSIGYVTKVNAGGTALLWSTYFGGSFQDQVTGMTVAPSGEILISGRAGSSDLVLEDTPPGCRPSANQVLGFVARLSADGASAAATQLVHGAPDCTYSYCLSLSTLAAGWPLALRTDGTVVVAGSNGTVAAIDFNAAPRVACVADPADNVQLTSVAPGQLLSIFGADIASPSSGTSGVLFNGLAAPVLYSSAQQINVQVPYEIAGASSVNMQVTSSKIVNPFTESRTLAVVDRQPAIFLSPAALLSPVPGYSVCGGALKQGAAALALNADGSINDCTNPAIEGSTVTVLLGGFGVTTPALLTGVAAPGAPQSVSPPLDPGPFTGTSVLATQTLPGASTGVAQVELRSGALSQLLIDPEFGGVPLRERVILIWTK